ncbi:MAG: LTA synthase family protein [Dehalobacter sp.]|jgi:phosphoglycerol transferase MdoB-like AlkP superfamily enzyme|nr:LTA synthase family protein [Dehalobacter sp.]OCZ52019.1 phosphoglycerol transferase [Dehalobacter sp. TeCB1]QHA01919.1 sulfatase-like hydrolase/transferase [Dehalobacter restrictus]
MVKAFQGFVRSPLRTRKLSAKGFLIWIAATAFVQVIIAEMIQRGDFKSALVWIYSNLLVFLMNDFLAIVLLCFFLFLTGNLRLTVISSSVLLILLSLTNMVKKQFLGDPLFPWDFGRFDQVYNLLPKISGEVLPVLFFLGVMIIVLILAGVFFVPKYRLRLRTRMGVLAGVAILIPLLVFYRHTPLQTLFKMAEIEHIYWVQTQNSLQNGFLLGFMMNTEYIMVLKPAGYSEETISKITAEDKAGSSAAAAGVQDSGMKPDIVVILDESFWDPTRLPKVAFSEDPLPNFRELSNEGTSGEILSPVFGGSTANVEFEFLTGLSTNFLPQGAIAYQQYVTKSLPALPNLLQRYGYETTAIHPYHGWFYDRDKIYPLLGFQHFYSLEDFNGAKIDGEYIADIEVSKRIIQELQTADQPEFIFAVTMQNHGPYPADRYSDHTVSTSGSLTSEGKGILDTYAEGVRDADASLAYLTDYLRKSDRPTIVVYFGDHLPFLGKDYQVYKETGYITGNENEWSTGDTLKMKSVPLIIWSNDQQDTVETNANADTDTDTDTDTSSADAAKTIRSATDLGLISPSFLGAYLLKQLNYPGNTIFEYTGRMADVLPVYGKSVFVDQYGQTYDELPSSFQEAEKDYWLLEYDLLFGKQYSKK